MPIHYGAIGLPTIDYYLPNKGELEQLYFQLADIHLKQPEILQAAFAQSVIQVKPDEVDTIINQSFQDAPPYVPVANSPHWNATDYLYQRALGALDILNAEYAKAGDNDKLDIEDAATQQLLAEQFAIMRAFARLANQAGIDFTIRTVGGTALNKLATIQKGRGTAVQTHLFGQVGPDSAGEMIREAMARPMDGVQIELVEGSGNKTIDNTKQSYVRVDPDNATERTILKLPVTPELIELLERKELKQFISELDCLLLEGAAIDKGKFGERLFMDVVGEAQLQQLQIIFAPPTATALTKQYRDYFYDKILGYAGTTMLTMNEKEGGVFFDFDPKILNTDQARQTLIDHVQPHMQRLDAMERPASGKVPHVEPVTVITNGLNGSWIVTPTTVLHVPVEPSKIPIDATGCGDATAAGAIIARNMIMADKRVHGGKVTFTDDELRDILITAQNMGRATIEQKGAQLPAPTVWQELGITPDTVGTSLQRPIAAPEPETLHKKTEDS